MSNRKKQIDNTLLAVGIGTVVTGITYGLYSYLRSKSQEKAHSTTFPSHERKENILEVDICPICLEQMTSNGTTFSCRHTFHKKCISQWTEVSKTCPVCRMLLKQM
ncbi:hypothetical protein Zmor_022249 [Zophobas morio]|uniref:RING-type domain-containing protein n=1 Tax=Zophobas morio TaxID=2755281 RepID=A0AA38HW88_9CUCU|nr:hypothetical protein Zmor_022249 [Zophobas morio]